MEGTTTRKKHFGWGADMEYFITGIEIKKVRHIENFKIPLSGEQRKHLLITGKNGSGKTSVLEEIAKHLESIYSGEFLEKLEWENYKTIWKQGLDSNVTNFNFTTEEQSKLYLESEIKRSAEQVELLDAKIKKYSNLIIHLSSGEKIVSEAQAGKLILAFFTANRQLSMKVPDAISKINFKEAYSPNERIADTFLQYLVYLKTQQAFALTGNDSIEAERIQNWFNRLEDQLKELFEEPQLKLEFDSKKLNFTLNLGDKREPFDFTTLSAGHTAYLDIVSELIMRMEKNEVSSYDLQGIVLIDEIETHLHVSLQKQILPFLTNLFPKIQFIVTTHSPFVLNSIPDTVICDLENRTVLEDFSSYSYESIVEKYFGAEQYSLELQEKMNEYTELMQKDQLHIEEELNLKRLRAYLESIPYNMAPEIKIKFDQLELDRESEQL